MTREEAFSMLDRMAKGIAEMFGSNCETVINDLADPLHPVLAIYNGHVSGRTVGSTQDVTGVEQDLYLDTDVVNLLAVTPSGQQTKSSTFSIKGEDYHFGFGINYDFTPLAYANRVLLDLIHTEVDFHSALYKPRDTGIGELFDAAMLRVGKPVREMTKADRLRVIEHLKGMDAFSYRRAVPYVASHLGVSRYTIYKYLDEVSAKPSDEEEDEAQPDKEAP
ncbi:MAG: helix-turn-helix transcriptional regulator [Clostridiales bacterium]|uniref:helix-turn-helix transcriptional regulator n=1 Tax=Evtepia sp. TaxID=2773933 RepID=UPI0029832A4B|nr:helix-turn-helix transcriptional regulator [Evtepia sp.]MDD7288481.1 helix-turn-helix transcriptional regulator [Clostridiales bacterium]MDY3992583.1 helix-turn-helix transcriptional regulator [Evtepia sp.]MDY4430292.1 helix-turn-helix transcriptional regulator [Evtepia sp.]